MAFGSNRGQKMPGSSKTPVHGAVNDAMKTAQAFLGSTVSPVLRGAADVAGAAGSIPGGVQKGLQDAGHNLFGPQTAIGGLFGGGSEKSASPSSPAPARPVMAPTSAKTVQTPAAPARPLVAFSQKFSAFNGVAPGSVSSKPLAGSGGTFAAKSTGAKASKRRKKQGKS